MPIEAQDTLDRAGPLRPDYIPEAFLMLQHASKHDKETEAIIEYLNDPDEILEVAQDLRGTRKIIFSLMLDLGLLPVTREAIV